jgi:superfamily II DNA helicase RecQ
MFEVYLGKKMYYGNKSPKNRIVQMFHTGTPKPVKQFITQDMSRDGYIRVLISTVAFGEGVDCKEVRRVVHVGPPKTIESYVQECGRAGRDGLLSSCVLMYNGLTSVYCESAMKKFLESEHCLRNDLMVHFSFKSVKSPILHDCCSICAKTCQCKNCTHVWTPHGEIAGDDDNKGPRRTRVVNEKEKLILKQELKRFQTNKVKEINSENVVCCPNILFELSSYQELQPVILHR